MGAKLPADAAEQTLLWISRYPGETGTSMLQDRKDGKPLEIEALTGTVVRLGEQLQIPTPLNCSDPRASDVPSTKQESSSKKECRKLVSVHTNFS